MNELKVGLLGFGTIGAGVVDALARQGDLLATRTGMRPVLYRVADLDVVSDRGVSVDPAVLTQDAASVVEDPATDIVVELIGGVGVARKLILRALSLGKSVVTANKALLAEYGTEIFGAAVMHGADLRFGASVGGGIPIIRSLREGLVVNRIDQFRGILNGTCNYILTRMEEDGMDFSEALAEAQQKGFAEADPTLDVDGIDTAHKAVILASLATGRVVPMDAVQTTGIRAVSVEDVRLASERGYRIKLLATMKRQGEAIDLRVQPTLVPKTDLLAAVNGVFNAVMIEGDWVGETLFYGRGAGREPTTGTVIADIVDAAERLLSDGARPRPLPVEPMDASAIVNTGDVVSWRVEA